MNLISRNVTKLVHLEVRIMGTTATAPPPKFHYECTVCGSVIQTNNEVRFRNWNESHNADWHVAGDDISPNGETP